MSWLNELSCSVVNVVARCASPSRPVCLLIEQWNRNGRAFLTLAIEGPGPVLRILVHEPRPILASTSDGSWGDWAQRGPLNVSFRRTTATLPLGRAVPIKLAASTSTLRQAVPAPPHARHLHRATRRRSAIPPRAMPLKSKR